MTIFHPHSLELAGSQTLPVVQGSEGTLQGPPGDTLFQPPE